MLIALALGGGLESAPQPDSLISQQLEARFDKGFEESVRFLNLIWTGGQKRDAEARAEAERQAGILVAQKAKFFEVHDELVAGGELSAEQKAQLGRIVYKLEAGKITAEEANRRLSKLESTLEEKDLNVEVKVSAQTNLNIAEVGEKVVIAASGQRYQIL